MFMIIRYLDKSMCGMILAGAYILLLAFLQILVVCFSNVSLLLHLAISHIYYFLCHIHLLLKYTASLELTNKWHLSALLFSKLFSNHLNKGWSIKWSIKFLQQNINQSQTVTGVHKLPAEMYVYIRNYKRVTFFVFNVKLWSLLRNYHKKNEFW